jgi:LmbE family N-acetylglucosaminyl deacetylase
MPHRPARLLVISPHFDDGVFGCGRWLSAHPDPVVLTVFAAMPPPGLATDWDTRCGFACSREAVNARYMEDDAALCVLQAMPLRLGYFDSQYGRPATALQIAASLREVFETYHVGAVAMPLGLFHSDHLLSSEAACEAMRAEATDGTAQRAWYAYADAIYRRRPGLVERRLEELRNTGVHACACDPSAESGSAASWHALRKAAALTHYASQLRALGAVPDLDAPEQYWRLSLCNPA